LRKLGEKRLRERLPQICEMAREFLGIDPAQSPIPVRPAVHYTMGGIPTDVRAAAPIPGLFAAGECASSGIHGANRLGSNSLAELCVFGKVAGEEAARFARDCGKASEASLKSQAEESRGRALALLGRGGGEKLAAVRDAMALAMENGCGIYRTAAGIEETCRVLGELKQRLGRVSLQDSARAWNTEWLCAIELGFQLDVAEAMAHSALARRESRGAHQRLDEGCTERDDARYLKHSMATHVAGGAPRIGWSDVVITRSPPGTRAYGAAGEAAHGAGSPRKAVNA
jgi:fumarate reductase flavoprotein subunit